MARAGGDSPAPPPLQAAVRELPKGGLEVRNGNPLALSAASLEAPLKSGLSPGDKESRAPGNDSDAGRGKGGKEGKQGKHGSKLLDIASPVTASQFVRHRPLQAAKGREADGGRESPIKESTIKALDRLLNDTLFKFPASDMLGPLVLTIAITIPLANTAYYYHYYDQYFRMLYIGPCASRSNSI